MLAYLFSFYNRHISPGNMIILGPIDASRAVPVTVKRATPPKWENPRGTGAESAPKI